MIPKKIHYIWFGGRPKPPSVVATIDSWRHVLPDFEIIQWDETNVDVTLHPWMARMHGQGKFAFASDWARLYILQHQGGIYLDTDVEIKRPLNPFLEHTMFWGFEYDCYLATCIIGSRADQPVLAGLLKEYDAIGESIINNALVTRYFLREFADFRLNNQDQVLRGDLHIFGKEYFSVPSWDRRKNFSRHHGSNLWNDSQRRTSWPKTMLRRFLGEILYYKLISHKVCITTEFYPICKLHKKATASQTSRRE